MEVRLRDRLSRSCRRGCSGLSGAGQGAGPRRVCPLSFLCLRLRSLGLGRGQRTLGGPLQRGKRLSGDQPAEPASGKQGGAAPHSILHVRLQGLGYWAPSAGTVTAFLSLGDLPSQNPRRGLQACAAHKPPRHS